MEQLLNPATLIFLIPIVAIIGSFIVKLRKMEIEREHSESVGHEEYVALRNEVISLRQRMENVETIVAGDEPDIELQNFNTRRTRICGEQGFRKRPFAQYAALIFLGSALVEAIKAINQIPNCRK